MGIETGADAYTRRVRNRLPAEIRADLESKGARIGDPILQLPAGRESKPPWPTQTEFLAKAPEARAILYGAVDESDYTSYVRIDRGQAVPPEVLEQLDFWRPVLMRRAEIERNPKRKWWETAWPRDTADLRSPKVIGVHRTNRGRFAVDEEGGWRAGKAVAVVVGADEVAPVAYLCGLLNSELIDL